MAQMEALIAEKTARTPAQRKISSALLYARSGRFDAAIAKSTIDPKNPKAGQVETLAFTYATLTKSKEDFLELQQKR